MGGHEDDDRRETLAEAARREDRVATAELILTLRRRGIRDNRVLSAIEQVPRRLFVEASLHGAAYDDRPLPIECGQTISAPSMVALMTEALEVRPEHVVLEVGTGSGFQAAVLSLLVREVYTIERYRGLVTLAEERFAALKRSNITTRLGDGAEGWPEKAPFDRIIVTAAAPDVPLGLVAQLKLGGIMIVPVGPEGATQSLVKVVRVGDKVETMALCDVRFVPLVPGVASRL